MSEVLDAPAAVEATPAAPESLLDQVTPTDPAPAEPTAVEFNFAEKVVVKKDDGSVDFEATARKAEQARQHLEKRLGAGDVPPKTAAEYAYTPPEDVKDLELDAEKIGAFKETAHKLGLTAKQFEGVMNAYLQSVPDLMASAAKLSAKEAREALSKTWATPGDMQSGLQNANRGLRALPADLQQELAAYGTDPVVLRALSYFGAQTREDVPPNDTSGSGQVDVQSLMMSEAYRNPKHPDHVRVSKQVADFYARAHGTGAI